MEVSLLESKDAIVECQKELIKMEEIERVCDS